MSMLFTPFIILFSDPIAKKTLEILGKTGLVKNGLDKFPELRETSPTELENHLVIIGYGLNGRNLAKAAYANDIPFMAIELNPDTVLRKNQKGVPIIYGDASQPHILETVN